MTIEEMYKELNELNNDSNLTTDEKKTYLEIYGAELERMKSDKYIESQYQAIKELRIKIIDDIIEKYPSFNDEGKVVANCILNNISMQGDIDVYFSTGLNDIVAEYELVNPSLKGNFYSYLDTDIHQQLEKIAQMERTFAKSVDKKYMQIQDKLSDIIDPEVFEFYGDDGNYKQQAEFDATYVKESKKIRQLGIGAKEKGMLNSILLDAIKYGKSYGHIYPLSDVTQYVEESINNGNNQKPAKGSR